MVSNRSFYQTTKYRPDRKCLRYCSERRHALHDLLSDQPDTNGAKSIRDASLIVGYSLNRDGDIPEETIFLSNQGLGPAFIQEVRVHTSDTTYKVGPAEYLISLPDVRNETTYINRMYAGRIVPANERLIIYKKRTDTTSSIALYQHFEFPYQLGDPDIGKKDKALIEIIYASVYGDRWTIRSDMAIPKELE